jgi:hypothetical protein
MSLFYGLATLTAYSYGLVPHFALIRAISFHCAPSPIKTHHPEIITFREFSNEPQFCLQNWQTALPYGRVRPSFRGGARVLGAGRQPGGALLLDDLHAGLLLTKKSSRVA